MNNGNSSTRTRRLAFIISGAMDGFIGAALVLLGFGVFPVDVTDYGFENWHALALGAVLFFIGVATLVYNLSRLEE